MKKISFGFIFFICACKGSFSPNEGIMADNKGGGIEHPNSKADSPVATPLLGNRKYIVSVFSQIFGSSIVEAIDGRVNRGRLGNQGLISGHIGEFGGACNVYSTRGLADCSEAGDAYTETETALPYHAAATSSREGFRLQACSKAIGTDSSLTFAIAQLTNANISSNPTTVHTGEVFDLFYPGRPPTIELKKALANLIRAPGSPRERWQALFTVICESPGWQLL